jgi:glycosyltransferase involved in cell wall biosynthesis
MFSVIIPLYNKELSISNTIQSVLNQTFQDFEIVIVNDGSTDNSVKEVEKLDDKRIRLIHQENQGVSAARNKGIKEARNEWVAFLDGDDLWEEDHLEEYAIAIQSAPNVNWLSSGYTSKTKKKEIDHIYSKGGVLTNVFEDLINGLSIHTSTVCIKKKLFDKYPDLYFRVGMNNSEDREVWYKLCCIDKHPFYINKSLSIYDVAVEGSLTKQKVMTENEHFLTMINRIEHFEKYCKINDLDKELFRKFIYKLNKELLGSRYVRGGFKKSHKSHLPLKQYYLYKYTFFMPYAIRRVINKVYRLIFLRLYLH